MENLKANRNHKDSVFTRLFSEKNNLLELYNAISGKNYPKSTEVKIITLSNVLFMEQLNDICFVIGNKLVVLMEHQSSINENICLRMLIYIAREYEIITNSRDLYREKRIKIPAPEFIVLYNGKKEFPDYKEIYLSDSFEFKNDIYFLELVAKVYNINKGKNAEISSKSPVLEGYETFIAEVKYNQKTMKLPEAIKFAVKSCINKNILLSFLRENGSEIDNMLLTEWNLADAIEIAREEAKEEGIAIGDERVKKERSYIKDLLKQGLSSEEILKRLER